MYSRDGHSSIAPWKWKSSSGGRLEKRGSSDSATFMRKVAEWLR
jgi:hypothetical protein